MKTKNFLLLYVFAFVMFRVFSNETDAKDVKTKIQTDTGYKVEVFTENNPEFAIITVFKDTITNTEKLNIKNSVENLYGTAFEVKQ